MNNYRYQSSPCANYGELRGGVMGNTE